MSLATTYLVKTSNLDSFFEKLLQAQAPEKFTHKLLENLGFKSTNDRLYISVLKSLGLLDEGGVPTQRYFDFLDRSRSKKIIAKGLREAYEDLFALNKEAYNMSAENVKNKFKSLTQGSKSDSVLTNMSRTFKALSEYADWSGDTESSTIIQDEKPKIKKTTVEPKTEQVVKEVFRENRSSNDVGLHYNIQIHLPPSRDPAVYDAIFQSLKKHILNG